MRMSSKILTTKLPYPELNITRERRTVMQLRQGPLAIWGWLDQNRPFHGRSGLDCLDGITHCLCITKPLYMRRLLFYIVVLAGIIAGAVGACRYMGYRSHSTLN